MVDCGSKGVAEGVVGWLVWEEDGVDERETVGGAIEGLWLISLCQACVWLAGYVVPTSGQPPNME